MELGVWNYDKGFKIYRNLHKDCWSVQAYNKDKKGWRLYAHEDSIRGYNAKFLVNEKGRQKVIKEKRKNVHAFVHVSDYIQSDKSFSRGMAVSTDKYRAAYYNPYKTDSFVDLKSKMPIGGANEVMLFDGMIFFKDAYA